MGRKLNALEEIQATSADFSTNRQEGRAQLQQERLLERIAEQLGTTTAELGGRPAFPNAIQSTIDIVRENEFALTRQCADLLKAFVQIQDPQDRLRCLQIVRDAAITKSP